MNFKIEDNKIYVDDIVVEFDGDYEAKVIKTGDEQIALVIYKNLYVMQEDNYYEETANKVEAKDTDVMPEETSTDVIPGTDVMYRPYREPQVDNSAIENHETAGQDSDGQNIVNKNQYPSTEISV